MKHFSPGLGGTGNDCSYLSVNLLRNLQNLSALKIPSAMAERNLNSDRNRNRLLPFDGESDIECVNGVMQMFGAVLFE